MVFYVTNKFALIVKGGDFLNYVHCNKKTRRVRRLISSKISQKDFNVWPFAGAS